MPCDYAGVRCFPELWRFDGGDTQRAGFIIDGERQRQGPRPEAKRFDVADGNGLCVFFCQVLTAVEEKML